MKPRKGRSRIALWDRTTSKRHLVAWWVGPRKRAYVWLGSLDDDGYERYITALSYGQAKALHAFLGEHLDPPASAKGGES